jgi:hypothetical protein
VEAVEQEAAQAVEQEAAVVVYHQYHQEAAVIQYHQEAVSQQPVMAVTLKERMYAHNTTYFI